jgi:hypothetical protein
MRFFKRAERPDSGPPGDEKVCRANALPRPALRDDYIMTGKTPPDVKVTPREWSPPD